MKNEIKSSSVDSENKNRKDFLFIFCTIFIPHNFFNISFERI